MLQQGQLAVVHQPLHQLKPLDSVQRRGFYVGCPAVGVVGWGQINSTFLALIATSLIRCIVCAAWSMSIRMRAAVAAMS